MRTTHHRGVNSYLDGEYKTNAIRNNIILSKSKYDSYFDVILHHERATTKKACFVFYHVYDVDITSKYNRFLLLISCLRVIF